MLLRIGLALADWIGPALPVWLAYVIADVAGRAWYRMAPQRRELVEANLARVCEATGRPTRGRAFRRLVRRAFIQHARYYMEVLRAPHYRTDRIEEIVHVVDWESHERVLREGGAVLASAHLGNFEPFGLYLAAHGFEAVAPIEEIRPRALFEFLTSRRGGGRGVTPIPLHKSRGPLLAALRRGGIAALVVDRDLTGDGMPVSLFGHRTTMPLGPAMLATAANASVLTGRSLRVGPERFEVAGDRIEWSPSGNRRDDITHLTRRIAERLEAYIAEAPEQWFGAFQPIWPDLRPRRR
jgi:KDO2-lipid IV(A) lauroyltransferase